MKLYDIYSRMKQDIDYIEKRLEAGIDSDHPLLREASLHLLKAGGKRIRPTFVLLSGQFGRYHLERLEKIAVPLELIHMATLVHDDVIDGALLRRGQLTVKSKFDNRVAMYTGDFIFAKALSVVTQLPNPRVHQILSDAIVEMCIGEMEQIRDFFQVNQSLRRYLLRIKRKTSLLIAVSCQLGALAAEAPAWMVDKLYRFGYYAGMAFQIRDDVLDICGTEKQLGKPPGSDIKQGNMTVPVLFALGEPQIRDELLQGIEQIRKHEGKMDVEPVLRLIRGSQSIRRAEQLAAQYINKAGETLKNFPDIQAKKDLLAISQFIGSRSY